MKVLDRLVDLFKEDEELRKAVLELIDAKIKAENALTKYRLARCHKSVKEL